MNLLRAALVSAVFTIGASAYTRATVEGSVGGAPLRWDGANGGPRFLVQQTVRPDLRNAQNRPILSPQSDPLAALQAALEAWSGVPGSRLDLGDLAVGNAGLDPFDGRNVFVFDDTPAIRALTDGALGVTMVSANTAGVILDADVVFNPNLRIGNNQVPYSTNRALNTIDLQDTATHLVGRALGAGVSGVIAAAMFPTSAPSQTFRRRLSTDDEAFLVEAYPSSTAAASRGEIFGTIRESLSGTPMTGVLVTAVDVSTGAIVQTVSSLADGTYRLNVPTAPVGRYLVYAESLDGPAIPTHLQLIDLSRFRTDARVEFFGGNASPTRLDVPPGRSLRADIAVQTGSSALRIDQIGVGAPGSSAGPERLTPGPVAIPAGQPRDLFLVGLGMDANLSQEDVRIFGPGVRVREGSVRVDPAYTYRGAPVLRLTVESDPRETRALATILVMRNRAADVFTGAIALEPAPAFSAEQVVNAASFEAGGVAPGGIFTLFGASLGPTNPIENKTFDAATGLLSSELGGVRVTFDGTPAPLFFVSAGQINLQAPFEIAGKTETVIRVERDGFASASVTVPVAASHPGIFTFPDGVRAVALNQDGSVNGPTVPAFRGEVITLFATGQGVVEPGLGTGAPAPVDPLRRSAPIDVAIGGASLPQEAVLFSGLTPGLVGLLQVNVRIPPGIPTGDDVSVVIGFHGGVGKSARISVR